MAKNTIGTLYDDNAVPIASGATGDGSSTYTGLNTNNQTWNGSAYERTQSRQGAALTSQGGVSTVPIAASTATDTVVKASAGRLCRVLVLTTAGAAVTNIYDNASGHTGTIIGILVASVAAGTTVDFQMPATNGITVQGAATNPGMTISFI